ncbi:MAG: PilC/PilY family type IV pilus protein [Polaromonas sp.]|nr:PilC/PilY family type IV pilus protein [Polaromonas sp.]
MMKLEFKALATALWMCCMALSLHAQIAQDPLLSRTASVEPNIVFMFDDSGSMPATAIYQYGGTAGGMGMTGPNDDAVFCGGSVCSTWTSLPTTVYGRSPDVNLIYYDPRVTYSRRINADGTFKAAGSTSGITSFNVYFYKPPTTYTYGASSVTLNVKGTGYPASGVTASFSSPPSGGVQATATVTTASTLKVNTVTVNNGGSNYRNTTTMTFSAPPAGGIRATGTVVRAASGGNGRPIIGITITNPGSGYTSAPTITLSNGGNGSGGATFTVNTAATRVISAIAVTNAGAGYVTPPVLTLNNTGTGAGASYTVNTASTQVPSINKTWDGEGTPTTSASYFTPSYTPDAGSPLATGATVIAYPNSASSSTANYPKFRNRTDCTSTANVCAWAEERQNYANWRTYHSTRLDLAKTGIGLAFQPLNPTFRLGWGTINNLNDDNQLDKGVRLYNSTVQSEFLTWLYARPGSGSTPNRTALNKVGQYFQRSDSGGPWANSPSGSAALTSSSAEDTTHATCRRSYAMLMTDGYYNESFSLSDTDTSTGAKITEPITYEYTPIGPYSDTTSGTKISNTFADVAMKYWVTDLRPNLKNNIKSITGDEAYWQHLNFYAIGLGVRGTLDSTDPQVLQSLTGSASTNPPRTLDWPTPASDSPKSIDDMWHATINGRGKLLNAKTSSELNDSINQMMSDISGKEGTQSGVAVSTASLTKDTKKYTPSYTPVTWNGNVTAYTLDATSGFQTGVAWQIETLLSTDAVTGAKTYSSIIPTAASRKIYVGNGSTSGTRAVEFKFGATGFPSGITGSSQSLVDYLRGDPTNEDSSATMSSSTAIYRGRATRLGDIVNSTPVFVKDATDLSYEKLPATTPGQSSYRAFVDGTGSPLAGGKKQRTEGLLFVGANDGMLHAFRDGTYDPLTGAVVEPGGVETFAYVPNALLPSMHLLADKTYVHRYYVDGPNTETDAYFSGTTPRWANIVLGTTGAGAGVASSAGVSPRSAVFAIDTTSLNSGPASLNASSVLWEVSSNQTNFSELGYVLTDVQAGPTLDGSWVAIFGNGYESKSCQARLYVVNIQTGARIREINTNAGNCTGSKNGLGGVRVVRNANQQIIGVYAGDLLGNLWKFNLNNINSANWGVDLGGNALFAAGATQPITAAPGVIKLAAPGNPSTGNMVIAGTGKFHEVNDITTTTTQSLYGIWDPVAFGTTSIPAGTSLTDKTKLVQQTIGAAQTAPNGNTYFAISTNPVDYTGATPKRGWYINLPNSGQRLVYPIDLLSDRFVAADTISPSNVSLDPCSNQSGGTGYLYLMDGLTGAGPASAILDTNGDGNVDSADLVVSGLEGTADGRNVTLQADKNASRTTYVNVGGGSPGATKITLTCTLLGTCVTPAASKIKSREWRQLFLR